MVIVESPPGFEAERFLDQLIELVGTPFELTDPDDIEGNAVPPTAILRAPLHAGLRGWRDTVVLRSGQQKSTIIVLPPGVSGDVLIDEPVPAVLVDSGALRFTADDIVQLRLGEVDIDQGTAELLAQLSDGWPAWLRAAHDAFVDEELSIAELIGLVSQPTFRRRLVHRTLREFSPSDRDRLAQLAHFDQFSDHAAKALGGAEFAFTVLSRAPGLYRTASGQLRFVGPVRQELMSDCALHPSSAELLAPVLVAEGNLLGACHSLLDAGMQSQAASMIERLPGNVIDMANQRELLGVFRVLGESVDQFPGLALKQARVHANLAEISASVEACEVAIEASIEHDAVRIEASVELLLYRHRSIDQLEAADRLADLRDEVGTSGPLSTRLREIEAQILGQSPDRHVVQAAADRFVEVASEWEYQQEYLRAAKTLRGLAMGPLLHLGRYREAQERLDKAASLSIAQTFDYGVTMANKAMLDSHCRDFDALARSRDQGSLVVGESGIRWLEGYLYMADAVQAAAQGSVAGVRSAVRTALDLLGPLLPTDTGLLFASEAAVLLAEVGESVEARRMLDSVVDRRAQNPVEFGIADIIVFARAGSRQQAWQAWRDLDQLDLVPNDRRWRIDAELARSDLLDGVESEIDLATIKQDLARLGMSDLLEQICPELCREQSEHIHIELLGGFRVSVGKREVSVPEGHVSELFKILAVSGGAAHLEFVAHHLWPDADRELGIRRLKNVVSKAREHFGDATIVRTPGRVALADHVSSDVVVYEMLATQARSQRSSDPVSSRSSAIRAIEIFNGSLLPQDHYSDFVNERRFELDQNVQDLLSFVEQTFHPNAAWLAEARQRIKAN